ncbi:hypothetical protein A3K87_13430 [Variovorax paradoxus]|uniref:Ferritin-like domain-containing protein n=1 Tax=Variovorax paradoxus TaxID=34073 RepID=A0AA91DPL7_VARPD|nr:diiron oxygenase [Variovorax paradoxus]OAK64814.1 hypothetical protein A3K87_13430 [Variovorax paradoxus]
MPADQTPDAAAGFDCLAPPRLRGWPALQARIVHHLKRAALRQLHASNAGEMLLLRFYLVGEESSEQALQRELRIDPPDWLARQLDQHLADEQLHARLFAEAINLRGGTAQAAASPEEAPRPDWFSRRKLARWQQLIRRHAPHFAHGGLVPAYAIGLSAEQMASRILQRHCALIGQQHPLHPLLSRVLADEDRHIRLCSHTLQRCVAPHEQARLAQLMREVRDTERGFGITGAAGMWLAGVALRLRPGATRPLRHRHHA